MFSWFERRLDPYPADPPRMPPQGLWRFILHFSRGAEGYMLSMAACSAMIAVAEVVLFGYLGELVNRLAGADRQNFWAQEGNRLILMGAILVIGLPLLQVLFSLLMHQTLMGNFPQRIRWQAHRYLLRQSMSYFQDEFAGRIATKLMQTALAVREVAMKFMDVLVYVGVYFIGALVLAASTDGWLAIPFAGWGILYGVLLWWLIPRIGRISEAQADARAQMTGRVVDSYTNISTVKLFSHSSREEAYVRESMDGFLQTVHGQMRLASIQNIMLSTLNSLLTFSVTVLGLWLWVGGKIEVGAVAVAIPLALRLGNMSHWIMWEFAGLFENIGTVRDGIGSLSLPRMVTDARGARPLAVPEGRVEFDRVTFRYGEAARPGRGAVLDDLSLTIAPGERIGLVGRSGAGKSTLVNLMLRFHDLESGRILIDGQDISQVTQESLRAAIGVVTQDTSLLHRSIRDNIAYGRPDASEAEILRAAELAEADFIATLTDSQGRHGLDAHVGERGVKLSGGQRQRIAIARVLLKDAPILVLDEATSALDSEVEAAIQSQLDMLMQGKTVIAIAHRLSTIARMDRLVVMEQGRIVEQGTHEALLARGGIYAGLWARQSGGFLEAE
ncbi:ABC transporter ATP-binding protein/permease [Paracoccus denitrificans]|jgi:ATP-binding cassette subfamily B multidrug efflux pump|uniref:ABC transporter related protein n=1 Tax=Paracoccus denitrificans (strain Pd 1222) TaxID=318586 RepID=A1B007_PARDP|nr:ABC transporter ATP-binding protein [Paracoccus denitrificans]ABL68851.1 ABC transporter related protein [Paracoccus denitrificans PD1222]MBB4625424.1 ATP-binding cassette subfamily B multidrug efflux pump [Paracoccus denitrificans]MCU7428250.1 ABC transporter ATP-binding protein/permease [Paracoccus denitrificans]QAR26897.1 ABC transporter ATP-binding protein [Paracoccus denitrificans]UFS64240.1 ABC transporter ATP-binding protein/permease [Paracoccus denitrificans]